MSKIVRVGMIGCGIGEYHLQGYAEEPRAKVVAIAGLDTDRCKSLQETFGVAEYYADYKELLAKADIDAVSVGVPNYLHLPIALAAIDAGKHVLMEKPLALNAAEGEEMVRAARKKGVILGIVFNRRARPDMVALRQHMQDGQIGDVYYAKAFWMRRAGIPGMGTWFTSKQKAGGGPLIDLGVHVLDMALWLLGDPEVISVSAATYAKLGPQGKGGWAGRRFTVSDENPYEVEDLATAFIRLEGGVTLQLETSWAGYSGHTDEFGVYLMGTKGGAELHVRDYASVGTLKLFGDVGGVPTDMEPRLVEKPGHDGHTEMIRTFIDSIIDGKPMDPSGEVGLQRSILIDTIYASAAEGREIRLKP